MLAGQTMAQVTIQFSHPSGCYSHPFALSIVMDGNDEAQPLQIRYTLNGGMPSVESILYENPVQLDQKAYSSSNIYTIPNAIDAYWKEAPAVVERIIVLRAAAFNAAGDLCSNVITGSYLIESLLGRKITLPILSLCVDSADFFDYDSGIFVPGASFDTEHPYETGNYYFSGRSSERNVHVDFFGVGTPWSNNCGVRPHGNISRRYVQKGLSLYARKEYGEKKFEDPFGLDIPCKHLVLRPFLSAWTPMGFQDYFCQFLARPLSNIDKLETRPVVLFLNGEYWGIYFLQEKPDEQFLQYHWNVQANEVHLVRDWAGHTKQGFDTAFTALMSWLQTADLSDERTYQRVTKEVDIESFIDYVILETFIGNRDWPANNMRCWSAEGPYQKWRFIFFDGDGVRSRPFSAVENALCDNDTMHWPTNPQATLMLRCLMQHHDFRVQFVDRLKELLSRDLTFSSFSRAREEFDRIVKELEPEIASQAARFGTPASVKKWHHAIWLSKRYWKSRSHDVEKEWITTINKRYGEHFCYVHAFWVWIGGVSIALLLAVIAFCAWNHRRKSRLLKRAG